jgi:hypothetical protein
MWRYRFIGRWKRRRRKRSRGSNWVDRNAGQYASEPLVEFELRCEQL